MTQLGENLVKIAVPTLEAAAVFVIAKRRRFSWRDDLRLVAAPASQWVLWLAIWVAWMLASDSVWHWRGPWDFAPWAKLSILIIALRVIAVGILGPAAEELLFRGLLYYRLSRTRLKAIGTIVVLAVAWAALHTAYTREEIALLAFNGVLLGFARYRSGSVAVPIGMHVIWNLYAIW
jgi:membrane protease YdiL (CAAX protease family)